MAEQVSVEYLCVRIGDVKVGIPSDYIEEVFEAALITRLPCTPDFILGMINVRGSVIPVLDLWEINDSSAPVKKIVILNTLEGFVGLLISELIDLIRFDTIEQSEKISKKLAKWKKFFPTTGGTEDRYLLMKVNEIISYTVTQQTRQAVS
jgi:chemotaxis signal transduction protein